MQKQPLFMVLGGAALFAGGIGVGKMGGTQATPVGVGATDARSQVAYSSRDWGENGGKSSTSRRSGKGDALKAILDEGDVGSRFEQLAYQMDRMADEDFALMLAEIEERGFNNVMSDERVMLISAWAKRDPLAAMAYLKENDRSDRMQFAAMATWASNDPDSAEAWARENHNGRGANDWMVGVIQGLASSDPERARTLAAELPRSKEQWRAIESTMPYVMDQGSDFSREWLEGLEDGRLLSQSAEWMARRMARENPEDAATWIASLSTKEARREASEEVALRYAREDLGAAQSWVSSLPQDTRTEAAEGVVSVMAKEDPRGAVAWLEQLGDDPDYDGAWADLVDSGYRAEPDVALASALRISDERWRDKYTNNYLSRWMKDDKAAATQFVNDYAEYLPPRAAKRFLPKEETSSPNAVFTPGG